MGSKNSSGWFAGVGIAMSTVAEKIHSLSLRQQHCMLDGILLPSIPGGVNGDFFRGYRRNHVLWGRVSP
jgi:hypothetical protein